MESNYPRKNDPDYNADVVLGAKLLDGYFNCDRAFLTLALAYILGLIFAAANSFSPLLIALMVLFNGFVGLSFASEIVDTLARSKGWTAKKKKLEVVIITLCIPFVIGIFAFFRYQRFIKVELEKYGLRSSLGWTNQRRAREQLSELRKIQLSRSESTIEQKNG
ncbi:MAG TPA: hypothetical protein VK171_11570 [Fimbriimonas sp.]|nr:hypothetical protein [Fimbriimonas sp.]